MLRWRGKKGFVLSSRKNNSWVIGIKRWKKNDSGDSKKKHREGKMAGNKVLKHKKKRNIFFWHFGLARDDE